MNTRVSFARTSLLLFFVGYLTLGLCIFKDYGLPWDEPRMRTIGLQSFNYAFHGDESLFSFVDRDIGSAFEVTLIALEKTLRLEDLQSIYYARHLLIFLIFALSIWVFYKLCAYKFRSHWIGMLGALCLVLSPRIFAESFYNSKDIVLLSFFIFSIYALTKFFEQPSFLRAIFCAFLSAFAIDIRLTGLIIPVIAGSFVVMDTALSKESRLKWKSHALGLVVYGAFLVIFVLLFQPVLWRDPIEHFLETLRLMSNFSSMANSHVFYFGTYLKTSQLPWHYLPVWLLVTTPIVYSTLFFVGALSFLRDLIKKKWVDFFKKDWLYFFWFFLPIFLVIVLHPILYDGWRHFYFIYPAFLVIALSGLNFLINFVAKTFSANTSRIALSLLGACLTLNICSVAYFMIKNHPYQNLYFNTLTGGVEGAKDNFDLDYWGLAYRKGLERIAKEDSTARIPVTFLHGSDQQLEILPRELRSRFVQVSDSELWADVASSKYVLTNFRWNQDPSNSELNKFEKLEVFSVKVDGTKIMSVYRLY